MLSAAPTIPATREVSFNPAFAPLSAVDTQMPVSQLAEPRGPCQSKDRDQSGRRHEIRIVEHRHVARAVWQS
jgi:hypothetical protein